MDEAAVVANFGLQASCDTNCREDCQNGPWDVPPSAGVPVQMTCNGVYDIQVMVRIAGD